MPCRGVWIRETGQVHLGRKFLTNNPEYAGKFWLYDNNQLIEQEPFEQPDTDNEPQPSWRGEDVELGLTWAAWQFAVDHGLLEDLQETFGEDTGTELLRFAIYRLCGEDSGMMNYADWLALVWLPQAQPLSSQRISEQLAVVDQSLMDRYFTSTRPSAKSTTKGLSCRYPAVFGFGFHQHQHLLRDHRLGCLWPCPTGSSSAASESVFRGGLRDGRCLLCLRKRRLD